MNNIVNFIYIMDVFDNYNIPVLREQFLKSEPFNYIVLDNFLHPLLANNIETELRNLPNEDWYDKESKYAHINNEPDGPTQSKKIALNIRKQIPDKTNVVIDLFSSPKMIKFIEDITSIDGLKADDTLLGGGVHKTTRGGHLSIHADFNINPSTNKHRRLNVLYYLNAEWKPEYNGQLELWDKNMMNCVHRIKPILNRLVIFRITDDALHGHPEKWLAPENYARLSLAFYYYSDDRPEHEKAPFHWALWHKRYGKNY